MDQDHNGSMTKYELAIIELNKLTQKELKNPIRTIAKMIGHSYGTTNRALKSIRCGSEIIPTGSKKGIKNKGKETPILPNKFTELNVKTVETIILAQLNKGHIDTPLIRCLTDFIIKVKGIEVESDGELDMELFLDRGKSLESSSAIHKTDT